MRLSNPIDPVLHPSEFIPGRLFELWERKWVPGKTSMEEYKAPFSKKDLLNYELNAVLQQGGEIRRRKCGKRPEECKDGEFDLSRAPIVGIWFTILLWNPEYKKSLEENLSIIEPIDDNFEYYLPQGHIAEGPSIFQREDKKQLTRYAPYMEQSDSYKVTYAPLKELPLLIGEDLNEHAMAILQQRLKDGD